MGSSGDGFESGYRTGPVEFGEDSGLFQVHEECVVEWEACPPAPASLLFMSTVADGMRLSPPPEEIARVSADGTTSIHWDLVEKTAAQDGGCFDPLLHAVAKLLLAARKHGREESGLPSLVPEPAAPAVFGAIKASGRSPTWP